MFNGVNYLNTDSKNRITIPARHREVLQNSSDTPAKLILTLDSKQCLFAYPEDVWETVRVKVEKLPNTNPLIKSYQRLILGSAETIEVDKAGRLLIPATLRQMVGITGELALVGMGSKLEIWAKDKWEAEINKALEASGEDLAELLNGLSI
ncbi:MAG: transcriptional regulator MraZ [Neisseriaceae bacterium]|nr:MAG: transcriptional regulator MraZ [Neisseriaceae bacterium]